MSSHDNNKKRKQDNAPSDSKTTLDSMEELKALLKSMENSLDNMKTRIELLQDDSDKKSELIHKLEKENAALKSKMAEQKQKLQELANELSEASAGMLSSMHTDG
jgi:chromosome segregation ATPase